MNKTNDIPFAAHCSVVESHIEGRYGIRVRTVDVRDPRTGDLDGAEIDLDFALTPEQRLFLLAHLFGHTVQWNVDPRNVEVGDLLTPPVDPALLPEVADYERVASGYALTMLHDAGITDADQWLADLAACDEAYLLHFYATGQQREFSSFFCPGAPLIEPLPIPPFTPAPRRFRRSGLVI